MADSLEQIAVRLADCHRCPLADGRTNIVFGVGSPHARVMFIGEAPGKNEDEQGEPFVGKAGKNLEGYLALAGLTRGSVYIANILKCRPPDNRNPKALEIEACTPFLRAQTRAVNPEIIVTLGNFASRFILGTDKGITELRGRVHRAGRFKVFPVFHPAAAIYDRKKIEVLEGDFKELGRLLEGMTA